MNDNPTAAAIHAEALDAYREEIGRITRQRDEARSLARFLRLELIDDGDPDEVDRSIREVELDLGEDEPLPNWLAADGQSDH